MRVLKISDRTAGTFTVERYANSVVLNEVQDVKGACLIPVDPIGERLGKTEGCCGRDTGEG